MRKGHPLYQIDFMIKKLLPFLHCFFSLGPGWIGTWMRGCVILNGKHMPGDEAGSKEVLTLFTMFNTSFDIVYIVNTSFESASFLPIVLWGPHNEGGEKDSNFACITDWEHFSSLAEINAKKIYSHFSFYVCICSPEMVKCFFPFLFFSY